MNSHEQPTKMGGVWSPYAIAVYTLLFSGFAALLLMAINFGRYGLPKRRAFWLIATPVLYLLFWAMGWVSPSGIEHRSILLNLLTIWIVYSQQIALHRAWKVEGKPAGPIWLAVLTSLGVLALMLMVELIGWYIFP